jgi:hypothetical protein
MGYKYFIFLSDKTPKTKDANKVAIIISKTIPIASVGPAKTGKT